MRAATVPTYTPGAAKLAPRYATAMSVAGAPARIWAGTESHAASLRRSNCAARNPMAGATWKDCTVSPGPARPSRRKAAELPLGVRTTYTAPWCPAASHR